MQPNSEYYVPGLAVDGVRDFASRVWVLYVYKAVSVGATHVSGNKAVLEGTHLATWQLPDSCNDSYVANLKKDNLIMCTLQGH